MLIQNGKNIHIQFSDLIKSSVTKPIYEFIKKMSKENEINFNIISYDSKGDEIENWLIKTKTIESIYFGDLNSQNDAESLVEMVVKPSVCELI